VRAQPRHSPRSGSMRQTFTHGDFTSASTPC
jgi:hypothetical protein